MGRKSTAGKNSRSCTFGAKLQNVIISSNFSLRFLRKGIKINFLPELVYICLKKHYILFAKYNLQSERVVLKHPVFLPLLQKDPSIIMVALFLTNYLIDIPCFTSFNLLIENSFLFILLPVLV